MILRVWLLFSPQWGTDPRYSGERIAGSSENDPSTTQENVNRNCEPMPFCHPAPPDRGFGFRTLPLSAAGSKGKPAQHERERHRAFDRFQNQQRHESKSTRRLPCFLRTKSF